MATAGKVHKVKRVTTRLAIAFASVMAFLGIGMTTFPSLATGTPGANPTCSTNAFGVTGCVQAYSNALVFSYTGFAGSNTQTVDWYEDGTGQNGSLTLTCEGPDYSAVIMNLSAGEYIGDFTVNGGGPSSGQAHFDLEVGSGGPPPAAMCNPIVNRGNTGLTAVGMAASSTGNGYWLASSNGAVEALGDATWYGDMSHTVLDKPIVGITPTRDGQGYWLDALDGGIFAFGDAQFYGSMGGKPLNQPMVGMAATPDGVGYWEVASDGGIFAFGDAQFYGSTGSIHLNQPVDGMAVDYNTGGYWMVASDGGIFAFNAPFYGSTGAIHLNQPIIEMEAAPDGSGYRFVAKDGGVFCFNLPYEGSLPGLGVNVSDVAGMAASGDNGYWIAERNSNVTPFGSAPNLQGP